MINFFALSSLALAALHLVVAPVYAHGYAKHPRSRQAFCKFDNVPGCGNVKDEPQSVDALKGSFACNGDGARFHELNNDALWTDYFTVVQSGTPLSIEWTLTKPHATATWEYFIITQDNVKVASFDDGGAMPPDTVVHTLSLDGYNGRQTILGRWNIFDTPAAFYSCIDLDIVPTNTATAVAGPEATQLPIGISLAGPTFELAGRNDSSSANTDPSVNRHLYNVFATHKA